MLLFYLILIGPGVAGVAGSRGFSGDGSFATAALLNSPTAVTLDSVGNLYIADTDNYRIRKVTNGIITTIAGLLWEVEIYKFNSLSILFFILNETFFICFWSFLMFRYRYEGFHRRWWFRSRCTSCRTDRDSCRYSRERLHRRGQCLHDTQDNSRYWNYIQPRR